MAAPRLEEQDHGGLIRMSPVRKWLQPKFLVTKGEPEIEQAPRKIRRGYYLSILSGLTLRSFPSKKTEAWYSQELRI
jgi:hypothetical protein